MPKKLSVKVLERPTVFAPLLMHSLILLHTLYSSIIHVDTESFSQQRVSGYKISVGSLIFKQRCCLCIDELTKKS